MKESKEHNLFNIKISTRAGDPRKVSSEYDCHSFDVTSGILWMYHTNGQSTIVPFDNIYWATITKTEEL